MEELLRRIPALYRVQLRTARYFDRNPALKTLLTLHSTPLIASSAGAASEASSVPSAIESCVQEFTAPSTVYAPPHSLYEFVRRKYNQPLVISEDGEEAAIASQLDVGFNAQRALVYIADLAAQLAPAEEHSAIPTVPGLDGLELRDAEALSPGCMLIEHPSATKPGRSLIYVYDISQNVQDIHGNEDWMVRGYVVNRPFPNTVEAVTGMKGLGPFGGFTMFHGGGDDERLAVIHAHGDVEGAAAVDESDGSLFVGGSIEAMNAKIGAGAAKAADFKALVGCVQLPLVKDEEGGLALKDADKYAFVSGSAVRALALAPAMFDTEGKFRDGHGLGMHDSVKGYNYARFWHQNAAWAAAVRMLAGGMDPEGSDPSWSEVRSWAGMHAGVTHIVQAALPLPYRPYDAAVVGESGDQPGIGPGSSETRSAGPTSASSSDSSV